MGVGTGSRSVQLQHQVDQEGEELDGVTSDSVLTDKVAQELEDQEERKWLSSVDIKRMAREVRKQKESRHVHHRSDYS